MAKSHSRQLIVESAIVGALLIGIATAGSLSINSGPPAWQMLANPVMVTTQQYNLQGLALAFNNTLADLGAANFTGATYLLHWLPVATIPLSLNSSVTKAISEFSLLNSTLSATVTGLNVSEELIHAKEFVNASLLVHAACFQLRNASSTFVTFQNATTPTLSTQGFPVAIYMPGESLVEQRISILGAECSNLEQLPTGAVNSTLLQIASPQKSILTGGSVLLNLKLTKNGSAVAGENVYFYLNGSYFGSMVTSNGGTATGNLTIPFVYYKVASVQAFAPTNSTIHFQGVSSNILYFVISFNETQIVFGNQSSS